MQARHQHGRVEPGRRDKSLSQTPWWGFRPYRARSSPSERMDPVALYMCVAREEKRLTKGLPMSALQLGCKVWVLFAPWPLLPLTASLDPLASLAFERRTPAAQRFRSVKPNIRAAGVASPPDTRTTMESWMPRRDSGAGPIARLRDVELTVHCTHSAVGKCETMGLPTHSNSICGPWAIASTSRKARRAAVWAVVRSSCRKT